MSLFVAWALVSFLALAQASSLAWAQASSLALQVPLSSPLLAARAFLVLARPVVVMTSLALSMQALWALGWLLLTFHQKAPRPAPILQDLAQPRPCLLP